MANIERRRKKRKLILISALAGAAAVIAAAVLAVILLSGKAKGNKESDAAVTPSPVPVDSTAVPAEPAVTVSVTEPEDSEPAPTATAFAEPTETEGPDASALPAATDTAAENGEVPIRISDEESSALFSLDIVKRYDASGNAVFTVTGRFAFLFVNNTDRPLYSAEFDISGFDAVSVTLNGAPAGYSVSDGVLTVPFLNELPISSETELYFELSGEFAYNDGFALPSFCYDTSYLMTGTVSSPAALSISGCRAGETAEGDTRIYRFDQCSVHRVTVSFRY